MKKRQATATKEAKCPALKKLQGSKEPLPEGTSVFPSTRFRFQCIITFCQKIFLLFRGGKSKGGAHFSLCHSEKEKPTCRPRATEKAQTMCDFSKGSKRNK